MAVSQSTFGDILALGQSAMDIFKMITELRAERRRIEDAILVVERLAVGAHGKRRGRRPKWMTEAVSKSLDAKPVKRRLVSPEGRSRMAGAPKKRSAAQRTKAASA